MSPKWLICTCNYIFFEVCWFFCSSTMKNVIVKWKHNARKNQHATKFYLASTCEKEGHIFFGGSVGFMTLLKIMKLFWYSYTGPCLAYRSKYIMTWTHIVMNQYWKTHACFPDKPASTVPARSGQRAKPDCSRKQPLAFSSTKLKTMQWGKCHQWIDQHDVL